MYDKGRNIFNTFSSVPFLTQFYNFIVSRPEIDTIDICISSHMKNERQHMKYLNAKNTPMQGIFVGLLVSSMLFAFVVLKEL